MHGNKSVKLCLGQLWDNVIPYIVTCQAVASPEIFWEGGVQQIPLRTGQRERGSGGGSPLVRGSGGSCNLVQEISFHIVKFS
jgi:hypothetical protein